MNDKTNSGHSYSEGGEVPKLTKPNRKAIEACATWLKYCLDIGWQKEHLDGLEKIWWEHHDEHGNLIKNFSLPATGSVAAPKDES